MQEQNHPLYSTDRDHISRMLIKNVPEESDLIDLGRLLIRYEDFPGAFDLQQDMQKILNLWGLSKESLNVKTREIWESGFRPGVESQEIVGSGYDASDKDEKS